MRTLNPLEDLFTSSYEELEAEYRSAGTSMSVEGETRVGAGTVAQAPRGTRGRKRRRHDTTQTRKNEKAATERARRLLQVEESLNRQLFQLRYHGAERIRAEHAKLVAELQALIKPDGSNLDEVERLLIGAAAVRDDRLAELARREQETADRRARANQRISRAARRAGRARHDRPGNASSHRR